MKPLTPGPATSSTVRYRSSSNFSTSKIFFATSSGLSSLILEILSYQNAWNELLTILTFMWSHRASNPGLQLARLPSYPSERWPHV